MAARKGDDVFLLATELQARLAVEHPELVVLAMRIVHGLVPVRHNASFTVVIANGKRYTFGTKQGMVVRKLWRARVRGILDVRDRELLNAADSDSDKLSDLFKDHPAWGTFIIPGDIRGFYRLADASD